MEWANLKTIWTSQSESDPPNLLKLTLEINLLKQTSRSMTKKKQRKTTLGGLRTLQKRQVNR